MTSDEPGSAVRPRRTPFDEVMLRTQPYAMCHLVGCHNGRSFPTAWITEAIGTSVQADRPELTLRFCLVAPKRVQRVAALMGVRGPIMISPKGIEKVGRNARVGLGSPGDLGEQQEPAELLATMILDDQRRRLTHGR